MVLRRVAFVGTSGGKSHLRISAAHRLETTLPTTNIYATLSAQPWQNCSGTLLASNYLWWSLAVSYSNDGNTCAGTELARTWAAPDPRVAPELRREKRGRPNYTSSAQGRTTRTRSELGAWTSRHKEDSRRQSSDQLAATADQPF